MNNKEQSRTSSRLAFVIVSVIVILLITAVGIYLTVADPVGEMSDADVIREKLDTIGVTDLGYDSVWKYFADYGIGGFDYRKIVSIENIFKSKYVGTMPDTSTIAHSAANLYLNIYYEETKDKGVAEVTDALLRCYTRATGDRYAVYRTYDEFLEFIDQLSGTIVGIGVEIHYTFLETVSYTVDTLTVTRVLEGSGAEEAGIKVGDLIIAVDGNAIRGLTDERISSFIRGEEGTTVAITVERDGVKLDLSCERRRIVAPTVMYERVGDVGYIAISSFEETTAELFKEAYFNLEKEGVGAYVFDVRSNPGGYFDSVLECLSVLLPKGTLITTTVEKNNPAGEAYRSTGDTGVKVPVVVLCNQNTASAGELFTAALLDSAKAGIIDATVVGTTTYGKGVMQQTYSYMLDSSTITLTMAYYNPPSGKNYDGVGITPDIIIEDSNEQYEKAMEIAENSTLSDLPNAA